MSTAAARANAARYNASTSTVAPHTTTRERLLSLDVFRGLTIAGMLLVNDPGTWSAIFPPIEHAEWHGWTPTDLIFPFTERSAAARPSPPTCSRPPARTS